MNEARFTARAAQETQALEQDLARLDQSARECDAALFGARYRRLSQQLALARYRGYRVRWIDQLNALALRGHAQLYRRTQRHSSWHRILASLLRDLPRAVRREWRPVLVASLLFYGSYLVTYLLVRWDPALSLAFMSHDELRNMEAMYDPSSARFLREREAGSDLHMFGFYIFNNIGIAFRTFASGVFAGIGSCLFLAYNGIVLGAVAAHLENVDMASTFYPFVIGHGAFELNAIVLSGAAGLMLGWSLLAPGRRTRAQAFTARARAALPLIYGFVAMLVVAAVLEAFWSSSVTVAAQIRYAVGAALWLGVLVYLGGAWRSRAY